MEDRRKIIWEWWSNPLGGGAEYSDDPEPDEDDDDDDGGPIMTPVRPVIPTSGGLIPLQVYGNFSANFDWWMMHTNFNLSKVVVDVLKRVPGVETCDVVTRYRARIGFAKCFKSSDVKSSIAKALKVGTTQRLPVHTGESLDPEVQEKVSLLRRQAEAMYRHWAIYVIPNGEVSFIQSDDRHEYERHLDLFLQAQKLAGGKVFTCSQVPSPEGDGLPERG